MPVLLGITIMIACQIGDENHIADSSVLENSEETMKQQTMNTDSMQVELTADPLKFRISEIDNFNISIAATNQGDQVVDPELYRARLFINGKDSLAWSDMISNGHRETKWFALPPGDTVSMSWAMGRSLFSVPGEYTLVLHYGGKELKPIQVHVLPE